ncbi:MAG TPA: hypothetical protein V6D46_05240, partial [Coleofasciculaceae cyanobacterium]
MGHVDSPPSNLAPAALDTWAMQVLNWPGLRVQVRSAGTHLHVLCEGIACPDAAILEARFRQGLARSPLSRLALDSMP